LFNTPIGLLNVRASGGKTTLGMGGAPFLDVDVPPKSSPPPKVAAATSKFRIHNVSVETLEQEMAHLLAVVDRLPICSDRKLAKTQIKTLSPLP
jgi:hypothetical protein